MLVPLDDDPDLEALVLELEREHLPTNALERALVRCIAENMCRSYRMVALETQFMTEAMHGDPDNRSRLFKLLVSSGDPGAALLRIQRYEAVARDGFSNALKQLRKLKAARGRV
jgi:hypothetical protein